MRTILILAVMVMGMGASAQELIPSVNVTGEGKVTVVPDEVTVRVSVENTGKDVKAVKTENDQLVDQVLKYLLQHDIPQNKVKTEYVNLNKQLEYPSKTYVFRAYQTITVKIEEIERYDEIMMGLLDAGVNNINGIEFSSSKMEQYRSQARKMAVNNAKEKAIEYASVMGQSIGKALEISEMGTSAPRPQPMYRMAMDQGESQGANRDTLSPGEMEVTARIQVSFELQ